MLPHCKRHMIDVCSRHILGKNVNFLSKHNVVNIMKNYLDRFPNLDFFLFTQLVTILKSCSFGNPFNTINTFILLLNLIKH